LAYELHANKQQLPNHHVWLKILYSGEQMLHDPAGTGTTHEAVSAEPAKTHGYLASLQISRVWMCN